MVRRDPIDTIPLFGEVPDPPVAPIAPERAKPSTATYSRYRPVSPRKCDDCMAAFTTDPNAPHSGTAAFRRQQPGAPTLLLCYAHKQMRQEAEGQIKNGATE